MLQLICFPGIREIYAATPTVFPHADANSITTGANDIPTEAQLDLPKFLQYLKQLIAITEHLLEDNN